MSSLFDGFLFAEVVVSTELTSQVDCFPFLYFFYVSVGSQGPTNFNSSLPFATLSCIPVTTLFSNEDRLFLRRVFGLWFV